MPKRKRGPKQTTQQKRDAKRVRRAMNQARDNESQQQSVNPPKADVSSLDPSSLTTSKNGNISIEVLSRSQSRKAINAAAKAAARAVESPEITASRRAANAERQRLSRQQETPETVTVKMANCSKNCRNGSTRFLKTTTSGR